MIRRRAWMAAAGLLAVVSSSWTYFFPPAPPMGPLARLEAPPTPAVIFAPHSDDEALAVGGLIQELEAEGSKPLVVLATGGDGFKLGAEAFFHRTRLKPDDMLTYGRHRLGESRAALAKLGLPASQFVFLGFPDQGLHRLWLECWGIEKPCTSPTTSASRVPYSEALHPGAPYAGEELLSQIMEILRANRPAVVVYPHPNEAHVDHWGLSNFVSAALENLRRTELDWQPPEEWFYLVHRGDWPAPKGYRPEERLLPPAKLTDGMTAWHVRPLTPEQVQHKGEAVAEYQSQVLMLRRYMHSFVRSNELFGTIDRVNLPESTALGLLPSLKGSAPPWKDLFWAQAITDPKADTWAREFERGADVQSVWAARDQSMLYLAAPMGARPKRPVEVRFYVRAFRTGYGWAELAAVVVSPDGTHTIDAWPSAFGRDQVRSEVQGTWVKAGLPLDALGRPDAVMVSVETRVDGVLVDRTAWRPVGLDGR
jgi:N-acetyl-1-D-myo-inositol-2-amino-2-deoxy-alpha-D-glucopyranoside deacetylase